MRPLPTAISARRIWVAIGVVAVLLFGTLVGARSTIPTKKAGPTRAVARIALDRLLRQGLLAPGRKAGLRSSHLGALSQVSYYNWSGYADDNSTGNTYTKVSANWTQPAVTCPANEDEVAVFWVGLDGFNDTTVEQDGTLAQCFEGSAFYYTWWEMYPTNSITEVGSTVKPGDHITASVSFASGKYTLGVMDPTTTGNGFSLRKTSAAGLTCANADAEWIAETPSYSRGYAPWPSFGTWKVTSAKATGSGAAGVISSFPDDQITIVGSFGEDLADTGTLNTAGNGFSDAWAFTW